MIALIDNPQLTVDELCEIVKGPDFPTGAYVYGTAGIKDYLETGRGKIVMRARAVIEAGSVMSLRAAHEPYDVILADPPYGTGAGEVALDRLLRLGFIGNPKAFDLEVAHRMLLRDFEPYIVDKPYKFTPEYIRGNFRELSKNIKAWNLPVGWIPDKTRMTLSPLKIGKFQ